MTNRFLQKALTFDDVLLVPAESHILPKYVDLRSRLTQHIPLNIPLLSAAMDTVTEARLAIALAELGGVGIIHKNMTVERQAREVRKVKRFESGVVQDPVTISPATTVREVRALIKNLGFSALPVVESNNQLVGIVTNRDLRFETDLDKPVTELMTPKSKLITVKEKFDRDEVVQLLRQHRLEKVLIVNDHFQLKGMITVRDILQATEKPNACRDTQARLLVGAAVGTGEHSHERINALVEADVDVLVLDTSHGHSKGVLDQVKWIKQHYPNVQLIAGNIVTPDAAKALVKAGADAVKVGIGPGSICTTRIVTGVGMPQLTAVYNVSQAVDVPVIADGGVRYSGDLCKAIAAGAACVMIGSLFAGTDEAPGEVELYQGRSYKSYRGMGSLGAMTQGSSDRYFQDLSQGAEKLVPEGIEGRVPYKGSMSNIVHQLMGGLRQALGYTGCTTIKEMNTKPQFVEISSAGVQESHVHGVHITKEAPNYHRID